MMLDTVGTDAPNGIIGNIERPINVGSGAVI